MIPSPTLNQRFRKSGAAACFVVFALLCLSAVAAGEPLIEDVVIRAAGDLPVDPDYVSARLRVRSGMVLNRELVNQDVRTLLDTGRFAGVTAEMASLPDGSVRLVYVLEPKPRLAEPVRIVGARQVDESDLREWSRLRVGDSVSAADAAAAAARVRQRLVEERYANAEVGAQLVLHERDPALGIVRLDVEENQRTRLQEVVFTGNTVFSDYQLRRMMRLPRRWYPWNWFRRRPYEPEELNLAGDLVRDRYLDEGYLDVRLGPIESHETKPGRRRVVVPITEGPRYTLGEFDIEGATIFDEDELKGRLEIRPGQTAGMSRIRAAAQAIQAPYAARGYRGTAVVPELVPHLDEPVVAIRFRVREGELTDIRMVYIRGNWKTRDKVIRRELLVAPGDRFDEVRIRRSERRLYQTGFFSQVNSHAEDWARGVSDVVFEVEEQQTGELMVGAGFSSIDRIMGFAEISQGNFDLLNWPTFTGGGQKLNLRAQFGSETRDYRLSFVEPWFLDRRLSLGVEGYVQQNLFSDFEVERIGGAVNLGVPLRGPHRLDMGYRFERSDLIRVADTNVYTGADGEPFFFLEEGRRDKSMLSLAVSRDTRDSFFRPSRGHSLRLGANYAGGWIGGDTDTYGLDARLQAHFPLWWRHVLSFQTRIDIVDTHGDMDDVPLADRLFAGGQGSVRGFRYRHVGPKAVRELEEGTLRRRPQGGRTRALATAEYTLPVFEGLRLAGFVDAGNVWLDEYEIRPDDLAVGAGIGVRFDVPGFPIRLDYAWPLQRDDPTTRSERFSFRIGHGF